MLGRLTLRMCNGEIEHWQPSLICFVLGASPPFIVIKSLLERIWLQFGIEKSVLLENGIYLVLFDTMENNRDKVLQSSIYHFEGRPLVMKPWCSDFTSFHKETQSVPLRMQLTGLDLSIRAPNLWAKLVSP